MKKILFILLLGTYNCMAQLAEIDSVKQLLSENLHDTVLILNYLELAHLYSSVNPDSGISYGEKAIATKLGWILDYRIF